MFAGFALIGGIWLSAGYYFTNRMAELERRSTEINARYTRAQDLLTTVRGHVLMGSVYVRDALLDPNPATADAYRRQLEESYRRADEALQGYVPVIDVPGEHERIARLRRDLDDFRRTLLDVLATDNRRWPFEARDLLRRRIMPKREGVMHVSEEVQGLNRSAFVQQQLDIASLYRATQRRVWETVGLALAASIAIALAATIYAGRLERRIQVQRLKEEERRSIARELHDEVGQVLTAIKVELAVAQRSLEAAGADAGALQDARAITDGAVQTVRDLSRLLHPAMLDDLGLAATVDWYLKGFGRRHGVRIELLQDRMEDRLASETEANAYRIVQEALTNVAKHAQAATCRVFLQRLPHTLLVTVEDDGIGFRPEEVSMPGASRGIGLVGIRERVMQLHGDLRLESAPGKGTRLTVELPARAREQEALAG
jgi:signal transduction histidine kinase